MSELPENDVLDVHLHNPIQRIALLNNGGVALVLVSVLQIDLFEQFERQELVLFLCYSLLFSLFELLEAAAEKVGLLSLIRNTRLACIEP